MKTCWKTALLLITIVLLCFVSGCGEKDKKPIPPRPDAPTDTDITDFTDESTDDPTDDPTDVPEEGGLNVVSAGGFEHFYELEFEKDNQVYLGFAEADGRVFYYEEKHDGWWRQVIGEDALFIQPEERDTWTVINTSGSTTTFTKDDFDDVLGCGGGYMLVYKNTGTESAEEYSYGLINSNGEWEVPLTPNASPIHDKTFVYAGEKTFIHHSQEIGFETVDIVFDCATNTTIEFVGCEVVQTLNNGKIIVFSMNGQRAEYAYPYRTASSKSKNLAAGLYVFETNGAHQELHHSPTSYEKLFSNVAIFQKDGYLNILDFETGATGQYSDIPFDSITISDVSFVGKYGLLIFTGEDGERYFTVIDANGQPQFEPRRAMPEISFNGDVIIYTTEEIPRYYEMIDLTGKTLIPATDGYRSLSSWGGTIEGSINSTTVFFNKEGQKITFHMDEK